MTKRNIKTKAGFTIIEVVLVLAIAGLIFMMVFLALPALQRSQRDTQRNSDMGRLQSALNNYQASNRNDIPNDSPRSYTATPVSVAGHEDKMPSGTYTRGTWGYFYDNYMLVGSGGATDTFADPDGEPYSLIVQYCGDVDTGKECDNGQRFDVTFDEQANGSSIGDGDGAVDLAVMDSQSGEEGTHAISVVIGATCDGEAAVKSSGSRKVAMLYKKEGGGVICLNN